ncbi:hypothetical protein Taro_011117 [Colocasia esculenta]|uniref:Pentatricopeptide repeat-containing protein n=1 Tax=Colocasia esculenta TaxID=4460 RepID=A0A843U910_COLES|nr:hypothetical protein [Colocasia esculenta]
MLGVGEILVTTTMPSVLAASAQLGSLKLGASVHGYLIRLQIILDVAAENSLVSMYAKCGCHKQCQHEFDMIQSKDIVSWNAMVAGYSQNGQIERAFHVFNKMRDACLRPDSITMSSLFKASASLGTLHHGNCIHGFIIRNQLSSTVSVTTSIIDMYSKCGYLNYVQRCFNAMQEQDLVLWRAIIASYGNHGKGDIALRLYSDFLNTGIEPNHAIYFISPVAVMFIRAMSHKPNADVLGILLDACRIHKNVSLGEEIAREINH